MAIAEIHVTLKPTLLDAQGATVLKALHQLNHRAVRDVRIGKFITLEVDDALSDAALDAELDLMCRQLLSNPVIENFEITIEGRPAPNLAVITEPRVSPEVVAAATAGMAVAQPSEAPTITPDPFSMDSRDYDNLSEPERRELQQLAWTRHGDWITKQLADRGAAWILVMGGEVTESGKTLDSHPSLAHLDHLADTTYRVPWVFTNSVASE